MDGLREGHARHCLFALNHPRQADREGRALTRLTRHRDVAAHHLAEAPTDHEAKPRAAVLARRLRGRLGKLLEQLAHLLRRHADAGVGDRERDPVAAILLFLVSGDGDGALFGELVGVAHEVQQRLPQPHLVGVHHPDRGVAMNHDLVAVLRRQRLDRLDDRVDQRRQSKTIQIKLHPPGLDLGEVEDVVDQGEQVAARAEHAVERLEVLLERLGILPQHLGDADDGIERGAQLVAHVGEELRLVLARLRKLPALLLDLVEQPRVLDGQHRLRRERLQQLDRALWELARRFAAHHQRSHDLIRAEQRYDQQGAKARDA